MSTKISFIMCGDIHFSDNAPSSRIDDYEGAMFDKIRQIKSLMLEHDALAFISTGDVFHHPTPSKTSHRLVNRIIREMDGFKFLTVAGNHDLYHGRLDSLPNQPLGVLFQTGTCQDVDASPVDFQVDDLVVRVAGVSYSRTLDDYKKLSKEGADFLLAVVHEFCDASGSDFFGEQKWSFKEMAESEVDYTLVGHDHSPQKFYEYKGKCFDQPGSLMRGALTTDNCSRDVFVTLVTIEKFEGDVRYRQRRIPLVTSDSNKIFNIKKHEDQVEVENSFKEFCDKLVETKLARTASADLVSSTLDTLDINRRVRDRVLDYLTNSGL
jgi:DNA repair exonuclease SbcCD nuclease subunit